MFHCIVFQPATPHFKVNDLHMRTFPDWRSCMLVQLDFLPHTIPPDLSPGEQLALACKPSQKFRSRRRVFPSPDNTLLFCLGQQSELEELPRQNAASSPCHTHPCAELLCCPFSGGASHLGKSPASSGAVGLFRRKRGPQSTCGGCRLH
jgi:hypothetical protein